MSRGMSHGECDVLEKGQRDDPALPPEQPPESENKRLLLETKRFAIEQPGRSWWNLVSTVMTAVPTIAVAAADFAWPLRLLASVVAGLLYVRLFVLFHDYQHSAILTDSKTAGLFFRLYGLLTLSPPSIWKHTHDHHHRNNMRRLGVTNVGSFPVMSTTDYRRAGFGTRFLYRLSRHPVTIAFGYVTVFFYGFCVKSLISDPRRHTDALASVVLHFALIAVLAWIGLDVLFFVLILPTFLGAALGSYLFYAQHNYPSVKLRRGEEWDYVFAALRSSSFIRMDPVMHWFTGNIGYHHVHHLNSRIPFYRLPEAMADLEELQTPGTTSLWPTDVARCLNLKLWDPNSNRMVTFAEARRDPVTTDA